jgi:competence protein ComGC
MMIALMVVSILLGVLLHEPKIFLTESVKEQDKANT